MTLPTRPWRRTDDAHRAAYVHDGLWRTSSIREDILAGGRPEPIVFERAGGADRVPVDDLLADAIRLAGRFAERGVGPGSVVGAVLPGGREAFTLYYASTLCDAVFAGVMTHYSDADTVALLRQIGADVVVAPAEWWARLGEPSEALPGVHALAVGGELAGATSWADAVAEAAAPPPPLITGPVGESPHAMMFTSGTTAVTKVAVHSESSMLAARVNVARRTRLGPDDVCLSVFGPGHIAGTAILIAPLVLDVPLVVAPRWETARIHELIRREGVTATMVTPHYAEELLRRAAHEREELPLRSVVIGGDVIRRDLVAAGVARGWQILGGYGATEASIAMGPLDLDHPTNPVPLLDGVDLALLDDNGAPVPDGVPGEVVIRCAPTELLGFVDEEAMTEVFDSAGFVHMGDIARQTPRGLELVGRRKDIAIRGGENISLAEVDGILSTLPGARDAAVVSVAAARGGEALVACVVPEAGTDLGMSDVLAHFRDAGASPHKVPKRVVRVATIPRTELGKVIRNDLAAQVQAHDR